MISHKHNTIFVHVPKTAGQSIELAFLHDLGLSWDARAPLLLRPNADPAKGPPRLAHLSAQEYVTLGYITAEDWDNSYRFGVVRDPFSRAVSLYRHLGPDMTFSDWVKTWLSRTLAGPPTTRARWFVRQQAELLCNPRDDVLVQDVVRFETLSPDFARVATASGLTSADLPRRNTTGHRSQPDIDATPSRLHKLGRSLRRRFLPSKFQRHDNWRDYYDAQTADHVATLYARDFEVFEYPKHAPLD